MIGNALGIRLPKSFEQKTRDVLKKIEKEKALSAYRRSQRHQK